MDQDRLIFDHALDWNVFIQQSNWKNDDPGQKSLSDHADLYPCSPFDLSVFDQRHFNNIDIGAGAFSIAVFATVYILQKRFYPQFNIAVSDYSFIAALKLKQQEPHWRKGHKFVQIVIQ
jgi:hypothetical protein